MTRGGEGRGEKGGKGLIRTRPPFLSMVASLLHGDVRLLVLYGTANREFSFRGSDTMLRVVVRVSCRMRMGKG